MPNWTTNFLACHEGDLHRIVNEDGDVDFNLVEPMPEELDISEGSVTSRALQAYRGENMPKLQEMLASGPFTYRDATCGFECKKASTMEELKALGARYAENKRKHGATSWYGWRLDRWGTKWNACETNIQKIGKWRIVRFETAWSQPAASLIAKAFEGSEHGFVFEAYDEDYEGVFGLGYERCDPVLLTEAEGIDGEFEYPELACCDDLDFDQLAAKNI